MVYVTPCRSWLYYITSPYVDSNTFTMGNPTPESTLSPSQGRRIWLLKTLNSAWCLSVSELLAGVLSFFSHVDEKKEICDRCTDIMEYSPPYLQKNLYLSNILTETYNDVKISKYAIYCYVSIHKPWLFPSYFVYIHQGGGKDERWCKRTLLFYSYNTIHWSTALIRGLPMNWYRAYSYYQSISSISQYHWLCCSCHPSIVKKISWRLVSIRGQNLMNIDQINVERLTA